MDHFSQGNINNPLQPRSDVFSDPTTRTLNFERLYRVGDFTVIGASGDLSDFQYTTHLLDTMMVEEYYINDGHVLKTPNIYEYLCRLTYGRRNKFDPLLNSYVVGGYNNGEGFLGFVGHLGTTYLSSTIATGIGAHIALPVLRKAVEGRENTLTEDEAIRILEECEKILYCRDGRSLKYYQRAKITAQGVEVSGPHKVEAEWQFGLTFGKYGDFSN
ncbi:19935_t:CDS:2 [Funneliformis geosporum]|uniref:Proteasome subunit beta n=1 Tax=Funneliformis geosporum TaxID=1117311 RepID=A0A9W4WS65_9GLOM|nr:14749_t:CDS:2 [Funneliformis geosporum]CAI2183676.1 19935_t:CDS:2 [Funneliformis geosporum]